MVKHPPNPQEIQLSLFLAGSKLPVEPDHSQYFPAAAYLDIIHYQFQRRHRAGEFLVADASGVVKSTLLSTHRTATLNRSHKIDQQPKNMKRNDIIHIQHKMYLQCSCLVINVAPPVPDVTTLGDRAAPRILTRRLIFLFLSVRSAVCS